jgi:hypothetical protein
MASNGSALTPACPTFRFIVNFRLAGSPLKQSDLSEEEAASAVKATVDLSNSRLFIFLSSDIIVSSSE